MSVRLDRKPHGEVLPKPTELDGEPEWSPDGDALAVVLEEQLYVMDEDGSNVTPIAPMTISSALHPTILADGRLLFTSHEDQGLRDTRLWGIWSQ